MNENRAAGMNTYGTRASGDGVLVGLVCLSGPNLKSTRARRAGEMYSLKVDEAKEVSWQVAICGHFFGERRANIHKANE